MQVFSTTINEILEHVYNAIAGQVSRKIIYQLGLEDTIKNHIYIASDVLGPSKSYNERRLPILHENAFKCNVKYSMNPFGLKWDSTTPGQHMDPALHRRDAMQTLPVFYDPTHNIQLIERYMPCNITLDCSIVLVDRVVAFDVMTRLMSTYVRGELMMVNDLSYDYRMPMEILNRLYYLGKLAGVQKGTYLDWLTLGSRGNIQRIVSTRTKNQSAEIVIKKQSFGSLAAIDYQGESPAVQSLGTSMDTMTIEFSVTIQFGRVNMLYLKYPNVINNQLIPEELVTADKQDAYGSLYPFIQHPYLALNQPYQFQKQLASHPARLPWYDDWDVPEASALRSDYCRPFLIGIFTLDNEGCSCHCCENKCCETKYTTINIKEDFDQYSLADNVLEWFKEHPEEALQSDARYHIAVFVNDTQMGSSMLKFDGENLMVPNCKGSKNTYHLVIGASTVDLTAGGPWMCNLLNIDIETNKE